MVSGLREALPAADVSVLVSSRVRPSQQHRNSVKKDGLPIMTTASTKSLGESSKGSILGYDLQHADLTPGEVAKVLETFAVQLAEKSKPRSLQDEQWDCSPDDSGAVQQYANDSSVWIAEGSGGVASKLQSKVVAVPTCATFWQ